MILKNQYDEKNFDTTITTQSYCNFNIQKLYSKITFYLFIYLFVFNFHFLNLIKLNIFQFLGNSLLTSDSCRLRWSELDAEKWSELAPNTS